MTKEKQKTKCEICGREICNCNFNRHMKSHMKPKRDDGKYHVDHDGLNCKFCNKLCKNLNSLTQHERTCPSNPNRNYKNYAIGLAPWNKGLTKETDERVRKSSEIVAKAMREKVENGWRGGFAVDGYWTEEKRKEQSELKKTLYKEHPEKHPNRILSNNRNNKTYPEQIVYDYLITNNINFIDQYETEYYDHKRFVDFYLPDLNLYIEVDGEYWHKDRIEEDKLKDEYALNIQGIKTIRISAKNYIIKILDDILK